MSNHTSEKETPQQSEVTRQIKPPVVSRRKLIIGGSAGAAALGWGRKEVQTINEGIHTPTGIFYALYESHDVGIKTEDAPKNLDGFMPETGRAVFRDASPTEVLLANSHYGPWVGKELLAQLGQDRTRIIYGDINPVATLEGYFIDRLTKVFIGSLAVQFGLFGKTLSRRNFLRKSLIGAGSIAVVPSFTHAISGAAISINPDQKDAIQRIIHRLDGLVGHLEPDNPVVFFRDLMNAEKLLTAAEYLKERSDRLPKIAFNFGAGHSGMEDLLVLGRNSIRWLINQYPSDYLSHIVKLNGGLENTCGLRMVTLPPVVTSDQLDQASRNSEKRWYLDSQIKDERVMDEPLLVIFKEKLI